MFKTRKVNYSPFKFLPHTCVVIMVVGEGGEDWTQRNKLKSTQRNEKRERRLLQEVYQKSGLPLHLDQIWSKDTHIT